MEFPNEDNIVARRQELFEPEETPEFGEHLLGCPCNDMTEEDYSNDPCICNELTDKYR